MTRRAFGTVRQLPSGNWQASYVNDGQQRRNAPWTFATRRDADLWLAQQERERSAQAEVDFHLRALASLAPFLTTEQAATLVSLARSAERTRA